MLGSDITVDRHVSPTMQVVLHPEIPLSSKKVYFEKVLTEPRYSNGYINNSTETIITDKA